MRHSLFTIALFFLFNSTKAQCPIGANAGVVFYMPYHFDSSTGPVPVFDTLNTFSVSNFQPNTTVYFYNNYNTLIDSVYTSSDGSGFVNLSPSVYDSIWPAFTLGFTSLGTASNGICTTDVRGAALLPVKMSRFTVAASNNNIAINWQTEMDEPGIKYIIQQSDNGTSFTDLKTIVSTSTNIGRYSYSGYLLLSKTKYFRIEMVNNNGRVSYSETKVIEPNSQTEIVMYANGHAVSVRVPINFVKGNYSVYNASGSLLASEKIISSTFVLSSNASKGVYFLKFTDSNGKVVTKSLIVSN
jgi:hypothetical protein